MSEIDEAIRAACDAGKYEAATELALRSYGTEIYGFLGSRMRSSVDAEEAFATFAEDVWKGLPQFAFRCAPRTWLYTVARNAANRHSNARQRQRAHAVPAIDGALPEVIARARTETQAHLRTEMKDRVRALRDRISLEDQTLLMLHIDRGLSWRELAMVMHDDGENLSAEALIAETARLRKRFERVKAALREMAIAEGLIHRPE